MIYIWLGLSAILILVEFFIPRKTSVFLGLGALSVAGLLHFGVIESPQMQISSWIASYFAYLVVLRPIALSLFSKDSADNEVKSKKPWNAESSKGLITGDRTKHEIDEQRTFAGEYASVIEEITETKPGRVQFGETSWQAISESGQSFAPGETVELVRRENISWIVKAANLEED